MTNTTLPNSFDAQSNGRGSSIPFVDEFMPRDPTTQDINYPIQKKWLNTATNAFWELKSFNSSQGVTTANWVLLSNQAAVTETLTGNDGIVVPPTGNNINVLGDVTNILTTGNAGTSTLTIHLNGNVATEYVENVGTAVPAAGILNVLGTGGITTTGSGNTITIENDGTLATTYVEDSGSATPSGGILNVIGGIGTSTSGSGNTITINATGTNFSTKNQVFTTSGTYTPTTGMKYCQVICIGAGGGGGGSTNTGASQIGMAFGGGGGEYAVGAFSASTIGASQAVTIGTGGSGGGGGANGTAGGNSSLGILISSVGGDGGTTTTPTAFIAGYGANGGTGGTGGDYRTPGNRAPEGWGWYISNTNFLVLSGKGADSQLGDGGGGGAAGPVTVAGAPGIAASGYGAGGGAGGTGYSVTGQPGANGAPGIVIIQEYIVL